MLRIVVTVSANSGQVAIRIQDMAGGISRVKTWKHGLAMGDPRRKTCIYHWKLLNIISKSFFFVFSFSQTMFDYQRVLKNFHDRPVVHSLPRHIKIPLHCNPVYWRNGPHWYPMMLRNVGGLNMGFKWLSRTLGWWGGWNQRFHHFINEYVCIMILGKLQSQFLGIFHWVSIEGVWLCPQASPSKWQSVCGPTLTPPL